MRVLAKLRTLVHDAAGVALVEIAFAMPILITLITGGVEIGRFVLLNQKLDRVAATMSDLTAQADQALCAADVTSLFAAVSHVAEPFDISTVGKVIVTSVSGGSNNTATVNWQRTSGSLVVNSRIGTAGHTATLPTGFTLASGDTVIIAEAFFNYTPMIFRNVVNPSQLYHIALFRPRFVNLNTLSC